MTNIVLPYDAFIRSIKQNCDIEHAVLLGAGASITSGIKSADDCIWEWKKDIFLSQNQHLIRQYKNVKSDTVKQAIQHWLDNEGIYPKLNSPEEYSFYAKVAHPIEGDRQRYFQRLSEGKEPNLGYHLLCLMAEKGIIRSVWSTNFDGLVVNAAYKNNLTPIEITLESEQRLYRPASFKELICVALHGDYKYGPMKNTSDELDNQSHVLVNALKYQLKTRHLIVLGYSGRDGSLMKALTQAYSNNGAGRVYWCGYGDDINPPVRAFIETVRDNGREAYFVPTDGFDKTMLSLSMACFESEDNYYNKISEIKKRFATEEIIRTPFSIASGNIHNIVKSNLSPFSPPKSCFQFTVKYQEDEHPWAFCRERTNVSDVTSVPHENMIYAYGTKDAIYDIFKDRLNSDIVQTPISRDNIIDISAFRELVLRTIVKALSKLNGYECNNKDKIWDNKNTKRITCDGVNYDLHEAIKMSLFFDYRYSYVSFNPAFTLPIAVEVDKDVYKEISRSFYLSLYQRKSNPNYNMYIDNWKNKLFGNTQSIDFEYPLNSGSGFKFHISSGCVYVATTRQGCNDRGIILPQGFNAKQIVHKGIEYRDPELAFYDPVRKKESYDFHPMRGLINNQPYDYSQNGTLFNPRIDLGVICPDKYSQAFYSFLNNLNQEIGTKYNPDYLISYPGFISAYGIPLNVPRANSNLWIDCQIPETGTQIEISKKLAEIITRKIERLDNCDVVVIYIPKEWDYFTSISDSIERFDLHDYIKAYAVQRGISTQLIRENTIHNDMLCQIIWWLSLAFYVKSRRTPWILTNLDRETAFAGLGYSLNNNEKNKIVLGCSHIYTAEGQGLKYKLSQINDYKLDSRNNPFLSEHEAYQLGINIRELFYSSVGELPKRVVLHKKTRFTHEEIVGFKQSLNHSGIENIDLIEINHEENARYIAIDKLFNADNFPVSRGFCCPITFNTAYLFTHGIAPSVRNPKYRYYKGGTSIPVPLKVKKHYGNSNIRTIATEIMGLSKMNWNSFDLYSKLPCTIQSSSDIAKIGWLLSHTKGRTYDYRNFI